MLKTESAYAWRRAWAAGGEQASASHGPPGPDRVLSEAQVQKLIATLQEEPAAASRSQAVAADHAAQALMLVTHHLAEMCRASVLRTPAGIQPDISLG